jgi:hypothetical protein
MATEQKTLKPANVHIQLRMEEANLIIMAMDSGAINLAAFQNTLNNVFYETKNNDKHLELMEKLNKVRKVVLDAMIKSQEKKSSIITE